MRTIAIYQNAKAEVVATYNFLFKVQKDEVMEKTRLAFWIVFGLVIAIVYDAYMGRFVSQMNSIPTGLVKSFLLGTVIPFPKSEVTKSEKPKGTEFETPTQITLKIYIGIFTVAVLALTTFYTYKLYWAGPINVVIEWGGATPPQEKAATMTPEQIAEKKAFEEKAEETMFAFSETTEFTESAPQYIEKYAVWATQEQKQFGIPASITLAQGLIETNAGRSKLCRQNNNHFGMKCFSRKCKKGHCSNFTDDTHKDFFMIYETPWYSFRAHSKMLSSGRYETLKKCGNDYKKWAYGLKSLGYATNPKYAERLIALIQQYGLQKYDQVL